MQNNIVDENTLGARIKKERSRMHLTQQGLGLRMAIDGACICKWEKNKAVPACRYLQKLAQIFNASEDYLLNGSVSSNQETLSLAGLTPSMKKHVEAIVEALRSTPK